MPSTSDTPKTRYSKKRPPVESPRVAGKKRFLLNKLEEHSAYLEKDEILERVSEQIYASARRLQSFSAHIHQKELNKQIIRLDNTLTDIRSRLDRMLKRPPTEKNPSTAREQALIEQLATQSRIHANDWCKALKSLPPLPSEEAITPKLLLTHALTHAIRDGNLLLVKVFLKAGVAPSFTLNEKPYTPIMYANTVISQRTQANEGRRSKRDAAIMQLIVKLPTPRGSGITEGIPAPALEEDTIPAAPAPALAQAPQPTPWSDKFAKTKAQFEKSIPTPAPSPASTNDRIDNASQSFSTHKNFFLGLIEKEKQAKAQQLASSKKYSPSKT